LIWALIWLVLHQWKGLPMRRMDYRPTDFMPQCKSVISIGLHILQGTADVWGDYEDRHKSITPYLFYELPLVYFSFYFYRKI
jgi:hypothetical protein